MEKDGRTISQRSSEESKGNRPATEQAVIYFNDDLILAKASGTLLHLRYRELWEEGLLECMLISLWLIISP